MIAATAVCAGGRSRRPLWTALPGAVGRVRVHLRHHPDEDRELTGPRALIEATLPAYDPMTRPKLAARAGKAAGLAELRAYPPAALSW